MTAAEEAKKLGFKSLAQVADLFDTSTETLRRWHKHNHDKFLIVLHGCLWHVNIRLYLISLELNGKLKDGNN